MWFPKISKITLMAVYLLIFVGGIVRSTGSGMGCPDWPKCFGRWMPPIYESQLPENYHEIYAHRGYKTASFDPVKTWIEYINRLLGTSIGALILLTFLASLSYRKAKPSVLWLSFSAFILVGVQGWLGAKVVATHLSPWVITLHMALALAILAILHAARFIALRTKEAFSADIGPLKKWIGFALLLTLGQILLGTQVREQIDAVSALLQGADRHTWVSKLDSLFVMHRSFSWIVLGVTIYLGYLIYKTNFKPGQQLYKQLIGFVFAEIVLGVTLTYCSIPAWAQPCHLLLGTLIFGTQFKLFLYSLKHS